MSPDPAPRLGRVVAAVSAQAGGRGGVPQPNDVCLAGAALLSVATVSMVLMADGEGVAIWAPTEMGTRLEELQSTTGEGPCVDAVRYGSPVLEPELDARSVARWPAFGPGALALGVAAAFAFPLSLGEVRVGVLNVYHDRPGMLDDEQLADAMVLADVATAAVLDLQVQDPDGIGAWLGEPTVEDRSVVHQATGMVAAQLNAPLGDALARMRAFAFANDRSLYSLALDVIARRQRFD